MAHFQDHIQLPKTAYPTLNFSGKADMDQILQDETTVVQLVERFHFEDMYEKRENFVSMLYYIGMLTVKDSMENTLRLGIPNYVIRRVYWEYFADQLEQEVSLNHEQIKNVIRSMRREGLVGELIHELKRILTVLSNRDLMDFNEKMIKLLLVTIIDLDGIYVIRSEMETNTGYIDIMLTRDVRYTEYTTYEWLIELKYLKESDRGKLEEVKQAGLAQLARYSDSQLIARSFSGQNLKKLLLIVVGKTEIYTEEL